MLGLQSTGDTPFASLRGAITFWYPHSDVSGSWTPSTGGSVAAMLNEHTLDRGTYATSPDLTTPMVYLLEDDDGNPATLPAGTYQVEIDCKYLDTTGKTRLVFLTTGGTEVGATGWQTLTGSDTTYNVSLTTTGVADRYRQEIAP